MTIPSSVLLTIWWCESLHPTKCPLAAYSYPKFDLQNDPWTSCIWGLGRRSSWPRSVPAHPCNCTTRRRWSRWCNPRTWAAGWFYRCTCRISRRSSSCCPAFWRWGGLDLCPASPPLLSFRWFARWYQALSSRHAVKSSWDRSVLFDRTHFHTWFREVQCRYFWFCWRHTSPSRAPHLWGHPWY